MGIASRLTTGGPIEHWSRGLNPDLVTGLADPNNCACNSAGEWGAPGPSREFEPPHVHQRV